MSLPKPINVLLMEDDPGLAHLIQKNLNRGAYVVEIASDGKQGIAMYKSRCYDIIIVDQNMPFYNGLEVVRIIASGENFPPTIMVTGAGNENIAVEALKLGVKDYIVKDVEGNYLKLLPSVIKKVLNQQYLLEEKKKEEESLRKSEEQYRTLVRNLDVGVYRSTPRGHFIQVNPAIARIFGYDSLEEFMKVSISNLYHNPKDRRKFLKRIKEQGYVKKEELRLQKKDGTPIWCSVTAKYYRDEKNSIEWIDGVIEDNTDKKRLENMQKKVQHLLLQSAKMEAIGRLAGGFAHEFNNLLTGIIGFTDLLAYKIGDNPSLRKHLDEIKKLSTKAASIAHQLLAFSSCKRAKKFSFSINTLLKKNKKIIKNIIGKNIILQLTLAPNIEKTLGTPKLIEQIIVCLVVNATEAMQEGGKLTIKTENIFLSSEDCQGFPDSYPGKFVCLSVTDTGIGMDEEIIHRIFEPFFSIKECGRGVGLGLSAVYGIVKQHNGWLDVESSPGKGSTFKIYLPIYS